jgi:hypothetical protein
LGGGPGGIHYFVEHFMDGFVGQMKKLEIPDITPALMQTVIEGVLKEANGQSVDQLAQAENKVVLELLALRAKARQNTSVKRINWVEIGPKAQRRIILRRALIQAFQFVALDYRKAVRRSDLSQHTMNVVFHRLF